MKLKSEFAILDITHGRKALNKLVERNGKTCAETHDLPKPLPVVIRGWITHRHGSDDGTSQEFGVEVFNIDVRQPIGGPE